VDTEENTVLTTATKRVKQKEQKRSGRGRPGIVEALAAGARLCAREARREKTKNNQSYTALDLAGLVPVVRGHGAAGGFGV